MSARIDIIRKVQSLRAMAAHAGTPEAEAASATALADRLVSKHGLREEDFVAIEQARRAGIFDGIFDGGLFGVDAEEVERIRRETHAQADELEQLKKDAVQALYRLAAFLQDDAHNGWRDPTVYETLEFQINAAKAQLKKCDRCQEYGFGPQGVTQRLTVGGFTKGGNKKYYNLHPQCHKEWLADIERAKVRNEALTVHMREKHGWDSASFADHNTRWRHQGIHHNENHPPDHSHDPEEELW